MSRRGRGLGRGKQGLVETSACALGYIYQTDGRGSWCGLPLVGERPPPTNPPKEWILRASTWPFQEGDVLCLLRGARLPIVVRLSSADASIIAVAPFPAWVTEQIDRVRQMDSFPYSLRLVWEWSNGAPAIGPSNKLRSTQSNPRDARLQAERMVTSGVLLTEVARCEYNPAASVMLEEAIKTLRGAVKIFEKHGGKDDQGALTAVQHLLSAYQLHIQIRERGYLPIAQANSEKAELLARLAHHELDHLQDGEDVESFVCEHIGLGDVVAEALIYYLGHRFVATEKVLSSALGHLSSRGIALLLDRGGERSINADTIIASTKSVRSYYDDDDATFLLMDRAPDSVKFSEILARIVAISWLPVGRSVVEVLENIARRYAARVYVTEDVLKAAVSRDGVATRLTEILLGLPGSVEAVTEAVIEAAAKTMHGQPLHHILERYPESVPPTGRVTEAIARWCQMTSVELFLAEKGDGVHITTRVLDAAAENPDWGGLRLLLKRSEGHVFITETVVLRAAEQEWGGRNEYTA